MAAQQGDKMSVPVGRRQKNKFEVMLEAQALAVYTVKICCNKNVFLPEYQSALTNDIIRTAKDIFINIWQANNILVREKAQADKRLKYQREAAMQCNSLLALMQIAKTVFHLSSKRIRFWGTSTIKVRSLVRAWAEADKKRYNF